MSTDELTELQEHAEHAKEDPTLAPVSVTMAVLAVLVAIASLLGHRAHSEDAAHREARTAHPEAQQTLPRQPYAAKGTRGTIVNG